MKPAIKFCGMTREADLQAAEALGVSYIGFVFVPSSPRSVSPETSAALRMLIKNANVVGVFADHTDEQITEVSTLVGLDLIQLHGNPDLERISRLPLPVIQAFRGVPSADVAASFLEVCPYILIDKTDDEDTADFDAIAALPSHIREKLFLAGGLSAANVASAVTRIRPYAVDVARGIESAPGVKDSALMSAFSLALP